MPKAPNEVRKIHVKVASVTLKMEIMFHPLRFICKQGVQYGCEIELYLLVNYICATRAICLILQQIVILSLFCFCCRSIC